MDHEENWNADAKTPLLRKNAVNSQNTVSKNSVKNENAAENSSAYCHGTKKKGKKLIKGKTILTNPTAVSTENAESAKKPLTKEVKLNFDENEPFTVLAFRDNDKMRLNLGVTKPYKRDDGKVWQTVMMPIDGEEWDKLFEKNVIKFKKDGEETVLGSATVGTLSIVNEATEQNGWPMFLDFTVERRDYQHHKEMKFSEPSVTIFYKLNTFLLFKKVRLSFKKEDTFTFKAFCGSNEKPLYSEVTKPEKRKDGTVWQTVMMPVNGQQWNGLDDYEKIIFKDGNGTVLGTATAQVLVKTSEVWLHFDEPNINYYYGVPFDGIPHVLYKTNPDSVHPSPWSSVTLLF